MIKRHIKRAKDDLLTRRTLVSKLENLFKETLTFFSTMARIYDIDSYENAIGYPAPPAVGKWAGMNTTIRKIR
jgi:hypothetical protein